MACSRMHLQRLAQRPAAAPGGTHRPSMHTQRGQPRLGAAVVGGGLSEALAVFLGYAVLVGSLFRSAPQIAKVVKARSCEGLSLTSVVVELLCYSVVVAYNLSQGYPFNTFGEVAACWVQDVVLIALILRFSNAPGWAAAALFLGLAAASAWLLSPACGAATLAALQASSIITMALGSRLPQIVLNWRRGDAGMLSVLSCGLNVAGNAARVFTTLVLTRDPLLLGGILTQGTMNCILLYQSIDTSMRRRRGLLPPISRAQPSGRATPAGAQQVAAAAPEPPRAKPAAAPAADGGDGGACGAAAPLMPQPVV
ncbi:MAG: hypothetical protein J3K34DRAFT_525994 [Monoraphidium minutum]|nr:MAG: hypothetical protein J3K34DRAFT_525994 [Monoraphidium minutum]